MNRREFFGTVAASAAIAALPNALVAYGSAPGQTATLKIDRQTVFATVPPNFIGLSYESAQLANPNFFSGSNTQLIKLFRSLGSQGVLRLGGGTSEFTEWTATESTAQPPFDSFGPDTGKTVKNSFPVTPQAIHNLRDFLDATNWQLLYGLKAAQNTPEAAAAEAEVVQQIVGPRLLAFQIGNEPDAWRNRYRPATWGFQDYYSLWQQFHAAIVARVPHAHFAGPDVSNHLDWVVQFSAEPRDDNVLLTGHYYAEGPASSPTATMDKLLSPNPKLESDLSEVIQASRSSGIPYRMTEGNSCWDGGKPGVSDTLGSALWAADMMLQFAQAGCAGVNLHGGGNGYYTPLAGSVHDGFTKRPEYFGMLFAALFASTTLVKTTLTGANDRFTIYAAQKDGNLQIAFINKSNDGISVSLAPSNFSKAPKKQRNWILTGPALESTQNVTLVAAETRRHPSNLISIPAHSAAVWYF